jgi:hypothetical protein
MEMEFVNILSVCYFILTRKTKEYNIVYWKYGNKTSEKDHNTKSQLGAEKL